MRIRQERRPTPSTGFSSKVCSIDGMRVEALPDVSGNCSDYSSELQIYRSMFEARFGAVNLQGWMIQISPLSSVDGSHGALTNWGTVQEINSTVTVTGGSIVISEHSIRKLFAHELYHVQLGPESAGHGQASWCSELSPWELANGLQDERDYLGCPR